MLALGESVIDSASSTVSVDVSESIGVPVRVCGVCACVRVSVRV